MLNILEVGLSMAEALVWLGSSIVEALFVEELVGRLSARQSLKLCVDEERKVREERDAQ